MNSKEILNRVLTLLYSDKKEEEVLLTYAKLKDGTIVESPTFDVGEPVEVISEDGTKTPAPDGEHELALKDESGNENLIKVITKDGVITERENVELEAETKDAEPIAGDPTKVNDVSDIKGAGDETKELKPASMLAAEEELPSGDGVEVEAEPMPGEEGSPFDMAAYDKKLEDMAYRIEEMEKKIAKMAEVEIEVKGPEEEEEEELPKLDGAPVEAGKSNKFSLMKANNTNNDKMVVRSSQNRVLDRLYN